MNNEEKIFSSFDNQLEAVIEPRHENLPFHFHPKLIYAFVPQDKAEEFLDSKAHKIIGQFDTVSFNPFIYEINYKNKKLTFCQAPLGAPAATQLLDWLISYGVKQVIAVGNAGALIDIAENKLLIPNKAIRNEGTSFHYLKPSKFIDLNSDFLIQIQKSLKKLKIHYKEVITWTTDGFFRETSQKIQNARNLGASVVEMECAALAACAQFRKVDFAQLLFTADTLADEANYNERSWGNNSYMKGMKTAIEILTDM